MLNKNLYNYKFTKEEENKINKRIVDLLLSIGISANLQGYYFIKESVKMAIRNPESLYKVTKQMYPIIAMQYNTTASRVERAIRHALSVSFNKGKITQLNEIFGIKIFGDDDKPTNSEFVALIADRISNDLK